MSDGNVFPEKPLRFRAAGEVCGHGGNRKYGIAGENGDNLDRLVGRFWVMREIGEYEWVMSCGPYKTDQEAEHARVNWFKKDEINQMCVVLFMPNKEVDVTNKENMDKHLQEMSDAEDRELIDLLTPSTAAEIETAIRVVQRINYGAAYGHAPKLCAATVKTLGALRTANAKHGSGGRVGVI